MMKLEKSAVCTVDPIPKCSFSRFRLELGFVHRSCPRGDWRLEARISDVRSPEPRIYLPIRQGRLPPQETAFSLSASGVQATNPSYEDVPITRSASRRIAYSMRPRSDCSGFCSEGVQLTGPS